MNGQIDGCKDKWIDEQIGRRIDRWKEREINGWKDK
jgi:hypothetical protein